MKFIMYKKALRLKSKGLGNVSGWQDSNLRPPGPKPGAITGLRYIPNDKNSEIKTRCFYSIKLIFDSFFKKLLRRGRDSIRLRRNRFTPSHFKNFCGEGGIRTLGTGLSPYNGLANRPFRPLRHLSYCFPFLGAAKIQFPAILPKSIYRYFHKKAGI